MNDVLCVPLHGIYQIYKISMKEHVKHLHFTKVSLIHRPKINKLFFSHFVFQIHDDKLDIYLSSKDRFWGFNYVFYSGLTNIFQNFFISIFTVTWTASDQTQHVGSGTLNFCYIFILTYHSLMIL